MQGKRNKSIIVIIIVLLLITAPLAVIGTYLKFSGYSPKKQEVFVPDKEEDEPVNTDSNYKDGKLYFYNENKELLGTYTCITDPCSYAVSDIDDKNYALDYLEGEKSPINVILNRYAFIKDDNKILLFDIINNETLSHYKDVKNYHNKISQDLMIVKNDDDKWGIIKLNESNISAISEFAYDFIGLRNKLGADELIDTESFVVKNGNLWGIIDKEGDLISNYLASEISSYNDILIGVKANDLYYLYDYYGKRVVDETGFNYVSFVDKYINIVDKSNNLYIYDYVADKKISSNIKLDSNDYKNNFTSKYNKDTNSIDVVVSGKDYSFSLS